MSKVASVTAGRSDTGAAAAQRLVMEQERGSTWKKWDLQIQPIKDPWFCELDSRTLHIEQATREFLRSAVSNEISVVAITDHNCGAAIDHAMQLAKSEQIPVSVLPGVEVDSNAGFQLLVIFNPAYKEVIGKATWAEAVEHFLNNACRIPSPVINADGQAEHIRVDIHELLTLVCDHDIGIPIFAHAHSDKGLFKKSVAAARKKFFDNALVGHYGFMIDHKWDADVAKTAEILRGWGFDPDRFACTKSSDAHMASEVGSHWTWIKADSTYEGLKQAVYDPRSRLTTSNAGTVTPANFITSLRFRIPSTATISITRNDGIISNEPFCFAGFDRELNLSPYLNCFVGGRGTGKSTILSFLGQYSRESSPSKQFWNRLRPSFDPASSEVFEIVGFGTFEFLGQSSIEAFATDSESFTRAIYERADQRSEGRLRQCAQQLKESLEQLDMLHHTARQLDSLEEEKASLDTEKDQIEASISLAKTARYSDLAQAVTEKTAARQELQYWKDSVIDLRNSIDELVTNHFSPRREALPTPTSQGAHVNGYASALVSAKELMEEARASLIDANFALLLSTEESLEQEIAKLETEISGILKEAGVTDDNIRQLTGAPQRAVELSVELVAIERQIGELRATWSAYERVLRAVEHQKNDFEQAIVTAIAPLTEALGEQAIADGGRDLKSIDLRYYFDSDAAWSNLADDWYRLSVSSLESPDRPDLVKSYIVDNRTAFSGSIDDIRSHLSRESRKSKYVAYLRESLAADLGARIFQICRDHHLNDVERYKRVQVLYNGRDLGAASFGQKCTAVMVVLLLFGNLPLIVDEPETHLDSSLIANYLVPLLKRKKSNRQVIFSTHNANFVVNGDAEKIFVLQNDEGITSVLETTIENLEHRDELLKLEGGREAFRKRGEKLQIS